MSATEELKHDVQKDPSVLEREAAAARADLQQTVETLGARFSPGELLDRSLEIVKENGEEFGRNLSAQVRNNPVPTLLAGIGIVWLMAASKHEASRPHASTRTRSVAGSLADRTQGIVDKGKSAAHTVTSAARHTADGVTGSVHTTATAVRSGARSARDGYLYLQREQPFVLGALAIAAGAAIGAAFPSTDAENEWLGDTSEGAKDRLKQLGKDKIARAERKVADAADAARESIDSGHV